MAKAKKKDDTAEVGDIVHAKVRKAFEQLKKIDEERDELNAASNEIRAGIVNAGINVKAFNAAYARANMDEAKRKAHDFGFSICCNAAGVGFQKDMFEVDESKDAATVELLKTLAEKLEGNEELLALIRPFI